MPISWNKFEGNVAAVHFPAGLAAGPCLYQILSGSNNKRRGDRAWQRYSGKSSAFTETLSCLEEKGAAVHSSF